MNLLLGGILWFVVAANALLLQFRSIFSFACKTEKEIETAGGNGNRTVEHCLLQSSFAALL